MLRLMLDFHPQLAWCSEFEFAVDHITEPGVWVDLPEYHKWLETDRVFQDCQFSVNPDLSYPELIADFLRQKQQRDRKPYVGATVHRHFDRLLWLWPKARFIHLVRDPRDVAVSCIGMGWAGNAWTGVDRWHEAEILWNQMKTSLTPDRYLEVRYEELLANPEAVLTQICEFLGVAYSPNMLTYPQQSTYSYPDVRHAYKWKKKMKRQDVQLIEAKLGELIAQRGYVLSGHPIPSPSRLLRAVLKIHDRLARIQFRIQFMGLPLFVADYIVRRIGIESWQRAMRLRLNQLEQAALK